MDTIKEKLEDLKTNLLGAVDTKAKALIDQELKDIKMKITELEASGMDVKGLQKSFADIQTSLSEIADKLSQTEKGFDDLQILVKRSAVPEQKKTFGQVFSEAIEKNKDSIASVTKGRSFKMDLDLKAVGNMTLGNNLTGTSMLTYGPEIIIPSTTLNLRDLVPSVQSSTLVRSQYKETGSEGSISTQTEGASKSQIDYDFTQVNTVTKYIAGYTRFSKQLLKALPFMQSTLPRLLMRDFYTQENNIFFAALSAAAAGSGTTGETENVKMIIDLIVNQRTAKFAASYVLASHAQVGRLNKLTYTSGNYSGSGGVLTRPDGSMTISGAPVIGVDWVADDKVLIMDRDYVERVEAESLTIEFFEQDSDNVQKNLITARVECLEEINPMFAQSIIYNDMGNIP